MAVVPAKKISWTPPPRCPACGEVVVACAQNMPLVQDEAGRVYCREHGHLAAPHYPEKLANYERWRAKQAERLASARVSTTAGPAKEPREGEPD